MTTPVPRPQTTPCENCGSDVEWMDAVLGAPAGFYEVMRWTDHGIYRRAHAAGRCQAFRASGEPWRMPERYEER